MMYRENGLIFSVIKDKSYGDPKIARILGDDENSWGKFKSLENTEWANLIAVVSEEDIDRALRGDAKSLMGKGLREPKGCLKKAPVLNSLCAERDGCISFVNIKCSFKERDCPDCFSLDDDENDLKKNIIEAWRKGYYVVRVL
jgi:hypothetical protein